MAVRLPSNDVADATSAGTLDNGTVNSWVVGMVVGTPEIWVVTTPIWVMMLPATVCAVPSGRVVTVAVGSGRFAVKLTSCEFTEDRRLVKSSVWLGMGRLMIWLVTSVVGRPETWVVRVAICVRSPPVKVWRLPSASVVMVVADGRFVVKSPSKEVADAIADWRLVFAGGRLITWFVTNVVGNPEICVVTVAICVTITLLTVSTAPLARVVKAVGVGSSEARLARNEVTDATAPGRFELGTPRLKIWLVTNVVGNPPMAVVTLATFVTTPPVKVWIPPPGSVVVTAVGAGKTPVRPPMSEVAAPMILETSLLGRSLKPPGLDRSALMALMIALMASKRPGMTLAGRPGTVATPVGTALICELNRPVRVCTAPPGRVVRPVTPGRAEPRLPPRLVRVCTEPSGRVVRPVTAVGIAPRLPTRLLTV